MKPREECGVFGVMTPKVADVAGMSYYGLYALQHRGQESCGIVVNDDGVFSSHKDLGLVSDVFSKDVLAKLPQGKMAVGHVCYGTTGASNRNNCQPIEVNHQKGRMALAHNGNLSNAGKLRDELELSGAIFHSTSDTETIAYIITRERLRTSSIEEAVKSAVKYLEGAYSLVLMSPRKLICVRDPHGFRPLCYGKTEDGAYVIASESCGLSAVGARFIRDVEPGELIVFSEDGVISDMTGDVTERRRCIFEYIYFARPDSVLDGVSVHRARDRRVVLIDDSIVRGNTSRRIVRILREAGAREIHMRISAPPFLFPCYYGTDIDSKENLIANSHTVSETAGLIGADSLGYLPVEELGKLIGSGDYCSACFDGKYPTKIPDDTRKDRFERKLSEL